ncbi:hypothetical protein RIF29_34119 [Crotalaria pallida]|uniref:Phosphatidic acid phosphatase type 2/haloperoxidase domain-containing protein n=1 Tax=Crotalaria pallida TaxID=3830 RepID=A0AAN9HT79_CROPI
MDNHQPPQLKSTTTTTTAISPPLLRHILTLDATISLYLHTVTKPLIPRPLLRLLELIADFRFFFPVTLSLFLATPPSSLLRPHLLLPLLLCSLLDLLFIALLKSLARRPRPPYAKHDEYNAVVSVDNFSFPSGHSSRVCFIASIFTFSRTWIVDSFADLSHPRGAMLVHRWVGGDEALAVMLLNGVVWFWALSTLISRVALGRHYVLDVFVGGCFGYLEALLTLHILKSQLL